MPWTTEAVYVYSGASKALVFVRYGDAQTSGFDRSIAAIPDVSGDGLPDVLAGGPSFADMGNIAGRATLYSGASGAELGRVYGEHALGFGWSVAGLGDLDGDGRIEFAAGGLDAADGYKGVLRLYSAAAVMPPSIYCTAKVNSQGCLPAIAVEGSPTLTGADDLVLRVDDVINNKAAVFIWGRNAGKLAAFDALICIGSPLTRTGPTFTGGSAGPDDCSGLMYVPFTHDYMSQQGIVAGDDVHVQGWYRDPALPVHPAGLSNAALFFVAP